LGSWQNGSAEDMVRHLIEINMSKFGKIYASLASIVVVVLFGLLVFIRNLPSEALVAFIGVLLGSLISSFVQYALSEANMRQQLRLAAPDKRLQAAQEAMTLCQRLRVVNGKEGIFDKVFQGCKDWRDTNSFASNANRWAAKITFKVH
jgi:hypothetical protein